jgi:hypothetical protein
MSGYVGRTSIRIDIAHEADDDGRRRPSTQTFEEGKYGAEEFVRVGREKLPCVQMTCSWMSTGAHLEMAHVYQTSMWCGPQIFYGESAERFWSSCLTGIENRTVKHLLNETIRYIALGYLAGEAAEGAARSLMHYLYVSLPSFNQTMKKEVPHWAKLEDEMRQCPRRIGTVELDPATDEYVVVYDVDEKKESFYSRFQWSNRYQPRLSIEHLKLMEQRLIALANATHELIAIAEEQAADDEDEDEDEGESVHDDEDKARVA